MSAVSGSSPSNHAASRWKKSATSGGPSQRRVSSSSLVLTSKPQNAQQPFSSMVNVAQVGVDAGPVGEVQQHAVLGALEAGEIAAHALDLLDAVLDLVAGRGAAMGPWRRRWGSAPRDLHELRRAVMARVPESRW